MKHKGVFGDNWYNKIKHPKRDYTLAWVVAITAITVIAFAYFGSHLVAYYG